MLTCPETWSVIGEHNQPGESYLQADMSVPFDDAYYSSVIPSATIMLIAYAPGVPVTRCALRASRFASIWLLAFGFAPALAR